MALDSKNNIKSVFIVPDVTATAVGTKITPGGSPNGTGTVVVTNVGNIVLDNTNVTGVETIKIVKDRGANLPLQQVRLSFKDIIAYSGACGVASTEQVSHIGRNVDAVTPTGTIETISNNFYIIKLEHVPNAFLYGKRPANYKYGTYQSGSSATQEEIVNGLVKSLVQNFKVNRTIDWRVISEVVNDAAKDTVVGSAGTLNFTKYSKTVVASATTASNTILVGDYISSGTAITDAVYKVVAIDSITGNITLNIPYQGDTVSGVNANTTIGLTAAAATTAPAEFGIRITGIKQKYDVNRWRQYDKVRFNVLLENFGNTDVVKTAATDGIGVYEQAANDEYISWGDEGQVFVDQVPPLFREQDAKQNPNLKGAYDVAILGWLNRLPSLIGAGENKGSAIFYMEDACSKQAADLLLTLDTWLSANFSAVSPQACCLT